MFVWNQQMKQLVIAMFVWNQQVKQLVIAHVCVESTDETACNSNVCVELTGCVCRWNICRRQHKWAVMWWPSTGTICRFLPGSSYLPLCNLSKWSWRCTPVHWYLLELQTNYTGIVCFVKGGTHWTHWALALESVLEALSKLWILEFWTLLLL